MITDTYNKFVVFGDSEPKTITQMKELCLDRRVVRGALMADNHLGYTCPVGGVVAFDNHVSVASVGYDIACGNYAVKTNLTLEGITNGRITPQSNVDEIRSDPTLNEIADLIENGISFGVGRKNLSDNSPTEHPLFEDDAWGIIPNTNGFRDKLFTKANEQLGTVGSGNHYVDIFYDSDGYIWIGVHFGSRGFGHTIASNFLYLGNGGDWGERTSARDSILSLDSQLGQDYWSLMNLAGNYAYAGREWVVNEVMRLMGGAATTHVHNHHNFAWKELHVVDGEERELVVVRKGATPARPGQQGFVGGSMGDNAVILQGSHEATDESVLSLYSTVHGAGRVMSRTEAAGKWDRKRTVQKRPGKVSPSMLLDWIQKKGVILRGGGLDESPHAYRRLDEVLDAQGSTIDIQHVLHPLVVVMAPSNEIDPYKD